MKKLVFMFVAMATVSLASCGGSDAEKCCNDSDSVCCGDSVVETVDSVQADSVVADSVVAE